MAAALDMCLVSKQLFRLIGVITRIQNIQNGKKKL